MDDTVSINRTNAYLAAEVLGRRGFTLAAAQIREAIDAEKVEDPRIARIEALVPIYVDAWDAEAYDADAIRTILRGDA